VARVGGWEEIPELERPKQGANVVPIARLRRTSTRSRADVGSVA
jgi:hypothetical protein